MNDLELKNKELESKLKSTTDKRLDDKKDPEKEELKMLIEENKKILLESQKLQLANELKINTEELKDINSIEELSTYKAIYTKAFASGTAYATNEENIKKFLEEKNQTIVTLSTKVGLEKEVKTRKDIEKALLSFKNKK